MNARTCFVSLAAMSLACAAFAAEPGPENHLLLARADAIDSRAELALDSALLDEYAGRYEAAGGIVLIVDRVGDSLTIELPESLGIAVLGMRAQTARDFVAVDAPVHVAFQTDADGRVTGMVLYPSDQHAPIPVGKIALRGNVTVHDVASSVAALAAR